MHTSLSVLICAICGAVLNLSTKLSGMRSRFIHNNYFRVIVVVIVSAALDLPCYSQQFKADICGGIELRPWFININSPGYIFSSHPIPHVNAEIQNRGVVAFSSLNFHHKRTRLSLGLIGLVRFDHIVFDQALPDTVLWDAKTGKSLTGIITDFGWYVRKSLTIKGTDFICGIGFLRMNRGTEFVFSRYIERLPNGDPVFILENHNYYMDASYAEFGLMGDDFIISLKSYYIGKNSHNYLGKGSILIPTVSFEYKLSDIKIGKKV